MNATRALLFDTSMPLWRYCLLAFPIALLPSLALFASANAILRALGVDPDHFQAPQIHATVLDAFGAVVFSPITETLLLAGGLSILSNFSKRKLPLAVASAIAWGCLHALFGALWFLGLSGASSCSRTRTLLGANAAWRGRSPSPPCHIC